MLNRLTSYFFDDLQCERQTRWFKRLLYLFLIYKSIHWLVYFDLYFGENTMIYLQHNSIGRIKDLGFFLLKFQSPGILLFFVCSISCIAIYRLLAKTTHPLIQLGADLYLWLVVLNLHNRVYPTLSGGNFLLNQYLLFNCLLVHVPQHVLFTKNELRQLFHNLAVLGIRIQIMLLYFISGLAKLVDPDWLSGNAITYTWQIEHFSLSGTPFIGSLWYVPALVLNYGILFYQITFPLAIWFQTLKKPFLIFGMLMHIYIALFMGLPDFGMIMLMAYLYFWPFKKEQA